MTDGNARPFTVVVCNACATHQDVPVIEELLPIVRRCPHGMLVSAECMLGPLKCASRPAGCGVMALLQPCTHDRTASGAPYWIGPITNQIEAAILRDWVAGGQWENSPLPSRLNRHQLGVRRATERN
ncbi:hypothetical protein [Mycobacterium sp. TY814]|uniref:hypothetical protein n=1 Tax=unclassified Mycobacterium TaxID=2642494 RepID=UPI002740D37B|nr:hypothetical protein [Mycobacterium sp. TY814]MDP7722882.1 hypothetical protein [Mycobacterium sp. TY814]